MLLLSSFNCCFTDDESGEMPLMKLTDEDRQVLMESLKEVEIDYPQLELLDTIGEGLYSTQLWCLSTLHIVQCVCVCEMYSMYSSLYSTYKLYVCT